MKNPNYKDRIKILEKFYICLLVAIFLIEFIGLVNRGDIDFSGVENFSININNIFKLISMLIFTLFFVLVKSISKIVGLTAIYIGVKIALKKHNKEKNKINDYKNDKSFYRDLLKKYSPGVLSYINNLNVNRNTLFITLMSLENKGVITFEEEIKVINENMNFLYKSERYVLEKIKDNNFDKIIIEEFKKIIEEECLSYELVKNRRDGVKQLKRISIFCIIFYILNFIFFTNSTNIFNGLDMDNQLFILLSFLMSLFMLLIIIVLPEALIVYLISYFYLLKKDPLVRTILGKELKEKLVGLGNYIREFGDFENKTKNEMHIWDDYLIYSVMLGENKGIISEYEKKLKNIV